MRRGNQLRKGSVSKQKKCVAFTKDNFVWKWAWNSFLAKRTARVSIKYSSFQRQCVFKLDDIVAEWWCNGYLHLYDTQVSESMCQCISCCCLWKLKFLNKDMHRNMHHTLTPKTFSRNHTYLHRLLHCTNANRIFNLQHIYRCIKH